jgi:hypothetical protein
MRFIWSAEGGEAWPLSPKEPHQMPAVLAFSDMFGRAWRKR